MPKRVKKSASNAKSKSFQSKNISLPHKLWLSAGIGAVILILAVMFLFPYLQGKVTGKAGEEGNISLNQSVIHPGAKLCDYPGINFLEPSILCNEGKEVICGGDSKQYTALTSLYGLMLNPDLIKVGKLGVLPYFCDGFYWHECNEFNLNKVFLGPLASGKCVFDNGKLGFQITLPYSSEIEGKKFPVDIIDQDHSYQVGLLSMNAIEWLPKEFFSMFSEAFLLFFYKPVQGPQVQKLYSFCDFDTAKTSDQATVCMINFADEMPPLEESEKLVINSISNLDFGAEPPQEKDGLLFLYDKTSQELIYPEAEESFFKQFKVVTIVLVIDVSSGDVSVPIMSFYNNLINFQKLAIKINGEYYLLSHPNAPLFDFNKLKLTHLPTLQQFNPKHIPKNFYQFEVFGDKDKALNIYNQGDQIVFTITGPGEAPQVYPLPYDLSQKYEIPFSATEPIKLTDLSDTLITVCTGKDGDNPADKLTLLICENNVHKLTLNLSQLTEAEIQGQKVALLFEIATEADGSQKKQAYLFWREELSNTINSPLNLDYNDLINNFVAGRRIAFSFGESVYLAKHPVSQFISLPSLELDTYTESGKAIYPASGSEKKVGFLIPEGKIILERDFSTPPPPFKVSALTKQQIIDTPVDLEKQLFASMSNQIPVKITAPDFGIISVNTQDDISADKDLFKISTEIKNPPSDFILKYGVPKVIENTLFYYFSASIDAGEFVKAVKIYRLYSLSIFGLSKPADNQHAFNDEFIKIFTAGNELAFRFDNSYYLLGYKGATEGTKAFFSLSDLTLRALNGSAEYGVSADLEAQTATFEVPEGNIIIWKDGVHNLLKFSATTKDILTLAEFEEYSMLLTSENKIKIGENIYKICDNLGTEIKEQTVLLCYTDKPVSLVKDVPVVIDNSLFWYQGKVNGKKQIKIATLFSELKEEPLGFESWGNLQQKVVEGKSPVLTWQKQYFEFTGTEDLDTFALKSIPKGELYPLQNIQTSGEGLLNGTFVYKQGHLLSATQGWTEEYLHTLTLTPLDYLLVTEEGFNVSADQKDVLFTPSLDAPIYHVEIIHPSYPELTVIKLEEKGQIFAFYLLPPGKIQAVLLPNGEVIEIEAIDTKTITLKK